MPIVGGNRGGIGGVRGADGSSGSGGGGGGGQCGCFAISDTVHHTEAGGGLDTIDVSGLDVAEEWVYWVESVGAPFRLDRSPEAAGLTVDNITIEAVLGEANSRWVRLQWQNPTWQAQTVWYIDPTGGNGNDENTGLTSLLPLATTAEYRRRVFGVVYPVAGATINFLSTSAVLDDGNFTGVKGEAGTVINLIGTPVKIGATGTIDAAVVPFLSNGRYTITDSSENWTANGWISTATNPRLIRNVAKTKHAWTKTDVGAGVVSISQPTDASETAGFSNGDVDFVNGESFEVCSVPTLPTIQADANAGVTIVLRCMKVTNGPMAAAGTLFGVLSGFAPSAALAWTETGTTPAFFNCFFGGLQSFFNIPVFKTCLAFGASLQFYKTIDNTTNFLDLQTSQCIANGVGGSLGFLRSFDNTSPPVTARYGACGPLIESLVGTGNTGKLVIATFSSVFGGANIRAATTDLTPFVVNGYDTNSLPMVDLFAGGGIFR